MKLKGWRTVALNVVASVPLILEAVLAVVSVPEFAGVLPEGWLPWYALGLAIGNLALRSVTTTPMGRSE